MNHLDWLLGALTPRRPPEGAITLPLFWEQWVLTGHILGGDEPLLRPVLGRELGEGGEARVLSPLHVRVSTKPLFILRIRSSMNLTVSMFQCRDMRKEILAGVQAYILL